MTRVGAGGWAGFDGRVGPAHHSIGKVMTIVVAALAMQAHARLSSTEGVNDDRVPPRSEPSTVLSGSGSLVTADDANGDMLTTASSAPLPQHEPMLGEEAKSRVLQPEAACVLNDQQESVFVVGARYNVQMRTRVRSSVSLNSPNKGFLEVRSRTSCHTLPTYPKKLCSHDSERKLNHSST